MTMNPHTEDERLRLENIQYRKLLQLYHQQVTLLKQEIAVLKAQVETQLRMKQHWLQRAMQLRKERDAARKQSQETPSR